MDLITLGKVQGIFGIKGWIKIYSWTQPKENIFSYSKWILDFSETQTSKNSSLTSQIASKPKQEFALLEGKIYKKGLLASLAGITDANLAQNLNGAYIKIAREDLPTLAEDDFYWQDLIGLDVLDLDSCNLGRVKNLMQTGANDCLLVSPSKASFDNKERILPYLVPEVIKKVDLAAKTILVDWDKDF